MLFSNWIDLDPPPYLSNSFLSFRAFFLFYLSQMNPLDNLVLVTALDPPGSRQMRFLSKTLASSLLRSLFGGRVVVERNFPEPIFPIERVAVKEIHRDHPELTANRDDHWGYFWRERVATLARLAEPASEFGWVVLCDADVVPLRNWDHLFEGVEGHVLVSRDSAGGLDAGFFAVRGERIVEFAQAWKEALVEVEKSSYAGRRNDGLALEAVLSQGDFTVTGFEQGEVMRPFEEGVSFSDCLDAAALHLTGVAMEKKAKLAFALHMMWVYGEDEGVFLDILEA